MPPVVEITDLHFAYGSQPVLRDVNLSVARGSILGVVGPNGGGKTTLLRLLLGQLDPTRGTVRVAGLPPREAVRRGDLVGYLPQHARLSGGLPLSVRQVVRTGVAGKTGLLKPVSPDDAAFCEAMIRRTGLADLADAPVATLSGGQLQRVYVARALSSRPVLLLLDEPTTGIDPAGRQQFIEFLLEIRAELGLTVVFVSHDLRAVSAISDRIACVNVTLHAHDTPDHLPADVVYRTFACDLEALGLRETAGTREPAVGREGQGGWQPVSKAGTGPVPR